MKVSANGGIKNDKMNKKQTGNAKQTGSSMETVASKALNSNKYNETAKN